MTRVQFDKVRTCEHDWSPWVESMVGFRGWREELYAPTRSCRKCGASVYRSTEIRVRK